MRKTIALKTLLRSPLKTLLTFLLIAATSFALFSRVTDYAVTMREAESAKSLYHAVASLDNEVPDIPMIVADIPSPDGSNGVIYEAMYEMEDKPWLTKEEMGEFGGQYGREMEVCQGYIFAILVGEGALRVIEGEPDNYLETEAFARQKGWADAINHNLSVYDVEYTSDMRAIGFEEKSMAKGRLLTEKDTDACVISEDFLKEYGLSIGDSINVQLGHKLCHDWAKAETERGEEGRLVPDAKKIPEFVESVELSIVGAYPCEQYNSPNTIYVPSSLLPVEVPADYEPRCYEFSVFVEDVHDIEAFQKAVEQFAQKVDLRLDFSDGGWLEVKDSFAMGAFTSLLATVLYAVERRWLCSLQYTFILGGIRNHMPLCVCLASRAGRREIRSCCRLFWAISVGVCLWSGCGVYTGDKAQAA